MWFKHWWWLNPFLEFNYDRQSGSHFWLQHQSLLGTLTPTNITQVCVCTRAWSFPLWLPFSIVSIVGCALRPSFVVLKALKEFDRLAHCFLQKFVFVLFGSEGFNILWAFSGGGSGGSPGPSSGAAASAPDNSVKTRLRWTPELHEKFVNAVAQLGGPERTYYLPEPSWWDRCNLLIWHSMLETVLGNYMHIFKQSISHGWWWELFQHLHYTWLVKLYMGHAEFH